MDLIGLLTSIINAVTDIYRGRKGLDTDGLEHEGRLSYEAGISSALAVFQEIQIARDTQIFILSELVYLQQEL